MTLSKQWVQEELPWNVYGRTGVKKIKRRIVKTDVEGSVVGEESESMEGLWATVRTLTVVGS